MNLKELIGVNKIFSEGKLINKSILEYALFNIEKSNDWQYNLITLLNAIICGHAFLDGNKRSGATLALWYFNKNNIAYDSNLFVKSIINVAKMKKPNFKKIQKEIHKCLK